MPGAKSQRNTSKVAEVYNIKKKSTNIFTYILLSNLLSHPILMCFLIALYFLSVVYAAVIDTRTYKMTATIVASEK